MAKSTPLRTGDLPHTDAYVELSLLDGGSFIGDLSKVHAGANGKYRMYNWAFHISHRGRHILWDLGLDEVRTTPTSRISMIALLNKLQDRSNYTPWVNKFMLDEVNHVGPRRSIVQQLAEKGVQSEQIEQVLFRYAVCTHPNSLAHSSPAMHTGIIVGLFTMFSTMRQRCSDLVLLLAAHPDI